MKVVPILILPTYVVRIGLVEVVLAPDNRGTLSTGLYKQDWPDGVMLPRLEYLDKTGLPYGLETIQW